MDKKIKIMGLVIASLLILVSTAPSIVYADADEEVMQRYRELLDKYYTQLSDLEEYVYDYYDSNSDCEEIPFSPEQEEFLLEFEEEVCYLYQIHGIPQYPQYPQAPDFEGINGIFTTRPNQLHIRGKPCDGPIFFSTVFCMDHNMTVFLADLVINGGMIVFHVFLMYLVILLVTNEHKTLKDFLNTFVEWIKAIIGFEQWLLDYLNNNISSTGCATYVWQTLTPPQRIPQPDLPAPCVHYKWVWIDGVCQPNPQYWNTVVLCS